MGTARMGSLLGLAAAVALVTACAAFAAEDDAALRKKALAMNDVTGDDPVNGEIKVLVDDPAGTKKLLAVATQMAKEKPQPFTYNGAYILAIAAMQLKEFDASRTLLLIC